jgi:hypothetical protein
MINQNPHADLLPEFDSMQCVFCSALNAAGLVLATALVDIAGLAIHLLPVMTSVSAIATWPGGRWSPTGSTIFLSKSSTSALFFADSR